MFARFLKQSRSWSAWWMSFALRQVHCRSWRNHDNLTHFFLSILLLRIRYSSFSYIMTSRRRLLYPNLRRTSLFLISNDIIGQRSRFTAIFIIFRFNDLLVSNDLSFWNIALPCSLRHLISSERFIIYVLQHPRYLNLFTLFMESSSRCIMVGPTFVLLTTIYLLIMLIDKPYVLSVYSFD